MITKIRKADLLNYSRNRYRVVFTVHDEDTTGEFGFIALTIDGFVQFKITEEKYIEFGEMTIIHDFMAKLHRIEHDDEVKLMKDEYNY